MKNPRTLIKDIYTLMETKDLPEGVDLDYEADRCGQEVAKILKEVMREKKDRTGLSLSSIGKKDRLIYNNFHGIRGEDLAATTKIKFLYGHVIEALVVSLVRMSGHTVTDQQKEVEVNGIKGHMDGRVDGIVMDIKSCSGHGFKKFKRNTLHLDDPYGYIGQLKAYAHAEGQTTYGWIAFDKSTGELCWLQYDETHTGAPYYDAVNWSVPERIDYLGKLVAGPIPAVCYEPVPDGQSGNMRLQSGCAYCQHKFSCWPEVRVFNYGSGPRYLTEVVRVPNVMEVPDGF